MSWNVDLTIESEDQPPMTVRGTVTPERQEGLNPAELLQGFLRNMDPAEVERLALENMSGLGGMGNGEAFLLAIRRLSGEQT